MDVRTENISPHSSDFIYGAILKKTFSGQKMTETAAKLSFFKINATLKNLNRDQPAL